MEASKLEGGKVQKSPTNIQEAQSSEPNHFYSPKNNVSASPVETLKSMISVHQTQQLKS